MQLSGLFSVHSQAAVSEITAGSHQGHRSQWETLIFFFSVFSIPRSLECCTMVTYQTSSLNGATEPQALAALLPLNNNVHCCLLSPSTIAEFTNGDICGLVIMELQGCLKKYLDRKPFDSY